MSEFFWKMKRPQAEEYFRKYVESHPQRLEEFRQAVAAQGGPPLEALDFSPESLVPVWAWTMPRIRRRENPPRDEEPVFEWAEPEDNAFFTAETLRLIDGLASYFAECVLRNIPGTRWVIGHAPVKLYVDENQPVIAGFKFGKELNPRQVALIYALGAADHEERYHRPESLLDAFRVWQGYAEGRSPVEPSQPDAGATGKDEAADEITIRVGSLEVALHRDNPDVPGPWVPGYERMALFFDDDAYVALEEDFQWTDKQLDALDAQLFAKLGEDVGVIWEDKEVLILYLPRRIRNPVAAVKKAVREMVRRPLPEMEIPRWSKRCREVGDTILRLARERN